MKDGISHFRVYVCLASWIRGRASEQETLQIIMSSSERDHIFLHKWYICISPHYLVHILVNQKVLTMNKSGFSVHSILRTMEDWGTN